MSSRSSRPLSYETLVLGVLLLAATTGFLLFAARTFMGIVGDLLTTDPDAEGGIAASATPYIIIDIVGVSLLGLGIAYGAYRYHTRDRRLDPISEAATKAQYDQAGEPQPELEEAVRNAQPTAADTPDFGTDREAQGQGADGAGHERLQPTAPRVGGTP